MLAPHDWDRHTVPYKKRGNEMASLQENSTESDLQTRHRMAQHTDTYIHLRLGKSRTLVRGLQETVTDFSGDL